MNSLSTSLAICGVREALQINTLVNINLIILVLTTLIIIIPYLTLQFTQHPSALLHLPPPPPPLLPFLSPSLPFLPSTTTTSHLYTSTGLS